MGVEKFPGHLSSTSGEVKNEHWYLGLLDHDVVLLIWTFRLVSIFHFYRPLR